MNSEERDNLSESIHAASEMFLRTINNSKGYVVDQERSYDEVFYSIKMLADMRRTLYDMEYFSEHEDMTAEILDSIERFFLEER